MSTAAFWAWASVLIIVCWLLVAGCARLLYEAARAIGGVA